MERDKYQPPSLGPIEIWKWMNAEIIKQSDVHVRRVH